MPDKRAQEKHIHFAGQNQNPEIFFRGGGSVLKPNHITRYEYPCPLNYGIEALRIQPPANASKRSRPQGRGDFGPNGAVFLTITRSLRKALTAAEFEQRLVAETKNDGKNANPLGRAMVRVTKYAGNTLLQSGKFKKREGLVYVIKRTTSIPLGGPDTGRFGKEKEVCVIPCEKWRSLKPPSEPGHDSWWQRLHELYNVNSDRAYWSTRDTMDKYGIPHPLIQWYPRPDVEKAVTIYRQQPPSETPGFDETGGSCSICSSSWFIETEYACQAACKKHWLCLECVIELIDEAGRGTMWPGEKDPDVKYWRCTECRHIHPAFIDRADIIQDDEFQYWRYKIARHRMTELITNWPALLFMAEEEGWCPALPPHLDHAQAAGEDIVKARVVQIHLPDAIQVMEAVPIYVASLLDWGFSLDNPVMTEEADVLKKSLVNELQKLSQSKRKVHTDELIKHLTEVGEKAFKPSVVGKAEDRLGNPIYPPGYEAYRKFLCEWTARACFLSPGARMDIMHFMERMKREKKKGWWKDIREVWFNRGAPV